MDSMMMKVLGEREGSLQDLPHNCRLIYDPLEYHTAVWLHSSDLVGPVGDRPLNLTEGLVRP
jgi:hypothetical protein